jgi:hypothetical protein
MINSVNDLKDTFSTGNQANENAFADLIDSAYNKNDDSVLLGPVGLTGTYGLRGPSGGTHYGLLGPSGGTHYGLLGPSGGTYYGFYFSGSTAPGSTSATGSTGQIIISVSGGTGNMYIHNGTQWFILPGLTSF